MRWSQTDERERERITIIILINATHNPGVTIRLSSIPGIKPNRYNKINNPQSSLGIGDTFWNCWTALYKEVMMIYLIKYVLTIDILFKLYCNLECII